MEDSTSPASPLSGRAETVERTKIRVMFELAEGHEGDLIRFEIGEPDVDTPRHIIDGAYQAAIDGATHYTLAAGDPQLRAAISEKLESENGVKRSPDEILITTGAVEAVFLAMLCTVDPGDEVIIPTPAWSNYISQVRMLDAEPVEVPLAAETGFDLDPEQLAEAITQDTAAIILASPANPTGRVYDAERVEEVVATAAANGVFVIADEVYEGLVYEGVRSIAPATVHEDWILRVHSFSKTFAMTGWRIGWLTGPADLIEAATKLHLNTTTCAPSISQAAARVALTGPQGPVEEMKETYQERRAVLLNHIADVPGISCPRPEGAFYVFVDVSALGDDSMAISQDLLSEYGVVTAPGSGFGNIDGTFIRLSYATTTPAEIREGVQRIAAMVRERGV